MTLRIVSFTVLIYSWIFFISPAVSALEKRMIRETLTQTNNNKSETARRLHITRRTLRLKIQKYQLDA